MERRPGTQPLNGIGHLEAGRLAQGDPQDAAIEVLELVPERPTKCAH